MFWSKLHPKKHPQEINVSQIHFLGEQDGPPEQVLKEKLMDFFQQDRNIIAAYLAQIHFGDPSQAGVALCLKTQFGTDRDVVEKISQIFSSIFGTHEHMDIIFLNDAQETELVKVCQPFFRLSTS
jgi:hypothetical protein